MPAPLLVRPRLFPEMTPLTVRSLEAPPKPGFTVKVREAVPRLMLLKMTAAFPELSEVAVTGTPTPVRMTVGLEAALVAPIAPPVMLIAFEEALPPILPPI